MCIVEDVPIFFKKILLNVLENKGASDSVIHEIRKYKNIKRIIVEDALIQRDLLYWLDQNTTVILEKMQGENFLLGWIACLYIGEIDLMRNLYICRLYDNKIVLLSPFPNVKNAILSKIRNLEREYAIFSY